MASVRRLIRRDLAAGSLHAGSRLDEVHGLGAYLARRVQRHLALAAPPTVGQFWARTRTRTSAQVERLLLRALQNRRGNQCVSPRTVGSPGATYHVQDVNHHAYEAVVALLDWARAFPGGVRYGALRPRMPRRSAASKGCGCRAACDGPCRRNADGACVPRRGPGFWGSPPHPDQLVRATTDAERRRVARAARTRMTNAARADADTMSDVAAGHRKSMRYSRRGARLSRVPSPKVRLP